MTIFSNIFRPITKTNVRPVVLLVLDGWGIAPKSQGNAIALAKTPVIVEITAKYPHGQLIASGESVGLPANEVGNTEVGHLTMGAGRVISQDLKRINTAIFNRTFFNNQVFIDAVNHTIKNKSTLNLMGLIGSGNVHSSLEHLYALVTLAKSMSVESLRLHLFTDGRDSPPQDAVRVIKEIEQKLATLGLGQIASISGRYYAMDRDARWDRTEKAYRALVEGQAFTANSAEEAINVAYKRGENDEFIQPTLIPIAGKPSLIQDNDAVIFYNFRIDRPRQLTMSFVLPDFESEKTTYLLMTEDAKKGHAGYSFSQKPFVRNKKLSNLYFVTMTEYQKNIPVSAVAFPPQAVADPLGFYLSKAGMMQMHMAESEKERFVTYYFNGLKEDRFVGEDVVIVPSPHVPTYDKKPEMSVYELERKFEDALRLGKYHFFVLNFANPDMVAHTGNIQATIKALEATDVAIGRVKKAVLAAGGTLLVTADHGNAEELITYPSEGFFFTSSQGSINTDHSNNPVPIIFVSEKFLNNNSSTAEGTLADIAPTILGILNIAKPASMIGNDLLKQIK